MIRLFLLFTVLVGCVTTETQTPRRDPVERPPAWSDKKRNCHTHYLDRFGLTVNDAVNICKEELHRAN